MCIDMCVDMCTDMCIDMCVDVCTDMCVDMCIDRLPKARRTVRSIKRVMASLHTNELWHLRIQLYRPLQTCLYTCPWYIHVLVHLSVHMSVRMCTHACTHVCTHAWHNVRCRSPAMQSSTDNSDFEATAALAVDGLADAR